MRTRYFTILLTSLLFIKAPATAAEGGAGAWPAEDQAQYSLGFLHRMNKELGVRWENLKSAGHVTQVTDIPITKALISGETEESKKFIAGQLGVIPAARLAEKALAELESNRKLLASHEKKASDAWDKAHRADKGKRDLPPEKSAFLYDMQVQAGKLGVILDNSPSMFHHLPALREKISSEFKGAWYVEVDGCELRKDRPIWGLYPEWFYAAPPSLAEGNPFDKKWYLPEIPRKDTHYHVLEWERNILGAFRGLVNLMEVDAIYWFCDFDDNVNPAAVRELDDLLTKKRKVRLYVHTVKSSPPAGISSLIKRTNGKLTRSAPVAKTDEEIKAIPAVPLSSVDLAASLNLPIKVEAIVDSARWVNAKKLTIITPISDNALPGFTLECGTFRVGADMSVYARNQFPKGRKITAYGVLRRKRDNTLSLVVESVFSIEAAPN